MFAEYPFRRAPLGEYFWCLMAIKKNLFIITIITIIIIIIIISYLNQFLNLP